MRTQAPGTQRYDCQTCGQNVTASEFHSYESCLLYKRELGTIDPEENRYIYEAGVEAMKERVKAHKLREAS